MASESSDESAVSVPLPSDLDEWLDAKAADLGVDRETVVVQLLASYRAATELDDQVLGTAPGVDVESEVRTVVADRIPDIASAVQEQIDAGDDARGGEAAGTAEAAEAAEATEAAEVVEDRLAAEIDSVEREFREKLQDVRERVVQVKREADAKAPDDHAHPEFGELATLSTEVESLRSRLDDVDETLADGENDRADLADRVDELEGVVDRLDDAEEKLRTVAWVVSDLRDAVESRTGATSAIDRLKRSAAEADVDRAVCEGCGEPVDIALLSEPTCPHCDAAVSDVELPGGFFGKPRLTVARRLEAGDGGSEAADGDSVDHPNVPDAARRE